LLFTPKKSLNDYLLHIRYGRHFGFDFSRHKDERMGFLRSFVSERREQVQAGSGIRMRMSYISSDENDQGFDFLDLVLR
jgi:hypothetical protein